MYYLFCFYFVFYHYHYHYYYDLFSLLSISYYSLLNVS